MLWQSGYSEVGLRGSPQWMLVRQLSDLSRVDSPSQADMKSYYPGSIRFSLSFEYGTTDVPITGPMRQGHVLAGTFSGPLLHYYYDDSVS